MTQQKPHEPVIWSRLGPLRRYALSVYLGVGAAGIIAYSKLQVSTLDFHALAPSARVFLSGIAWIMILIVGGVFTAVIAIQSAIMERIREAAEAAEATFRTRETLSAAAAERRIAQSEHEGREPREDERP